MPIPTDKHNFEQAILDFPKSIAEGINLAKDLKIDAVFNSAAICGMGASSMAAELISATTPSQHPIYAVRKYTLPPQVNKQTLVIASSYSGNTEETLACYGHAKEEGFLVVALSKNGKLEEMATSDSIAFIKYPDYWEGFQPRWAFGMSFATLGTILENVNIISGFKTELEPAVTRLDMEELRNKGEEIAKQLLDKEPAIYGPQELAYLARIWQINLNEDAKVPASWNYFPEANHYETTGYTQNNGNRIAVMLRDPEDNPRIAQRMEVTAKLLKEKNVDTIFVDLPTGSTALRILTGLALSMWTCYHLAAMYKIDPAPTEMVEKLKKMLG